MTIIPEVSEHRPQATEARLSLTRFSLPTTLYMGPREIRSTASGQRDDLTHTLTRDDVLSSIARCQLLDEAHSSILTMRACVMTDTSPISVPRSTSSSQAASRLLSGATLHTCDDRGVIEIGCVLVNPQGEIEWVGDLQEWTEVARTLTERTIDVIDCTGEHICPGFIDAHVHMGLYPEGFIGEPKDLNELTTPLTPQLRALDGIWPEDIAFEKARRGGVTTICVLPGSANVIGGAGVILKTAGIDVEEMCVKEPACLKIAFGYNVKYNHGQKGRAPLTRMMLTSMMRDAFDEALRYEERRLLKPETPIDRGHETILSALRREIPVRAHASRSDDILTATRLARDYGFDLIIEHGYEADRVIPQLLKVGASVVYGPAFRTCGHSEDLHFDFADAQTLINAGIKVAQMTDHPIVPVQYLSLQAGLCVRAGMSEPEALMLITAYPAELLRVDDRIGRLRVGLEADLLRLSGPPLEVKTRVFETWINGEVVVREAR